MSTLSVNPNRVKLTNHEEYQKGVAGMEAIENLLKLVNISSVSDIHEIGSLAPWQAGKKYRKSSLSVNPKFSPNGISFDVPNQNPHPPLMITPH